VADGSSVIMPKHMLLQAVVMECACIAVVNVSVGVKELSGEHSDAK
jgi:hypothetical protein